MASVAPEGLPEKKKWKFCSETMQVKVIVIVLTVVMAAFEVGDRILGGRLCRLLFRGHIA